ncbi:hypothetical protein [Sphingomonas xinjiangensis]|nr:hypothetical protein [Sphingomonas xinjiangensis]
MSKRALKVIGFASFFGMTGCDAGADISAAKQEVAKAVQAPGGPNPEFRNLAVPKSGIVCGEVRYIAPSGNWSSYWRFHVIAGVASIEPSLPIVPYEAEQRLPGWYAEDEVCRR